MSNTHSQAWLGEKPVIGITMGDPAGIGPELCLRILATRQITQRCVPLVFGHRDMLTQVARRIGVRMPSRIITPDEWKRHETPDAQMIVHCGNTELAGIKAGKVQESCGKAACEYVMSAARAAMDQRLAAIVTAPIHKEAFRLAGIPYPGHTELLAAVTGAKHVCMMMASNKLAVCLVTAHTRYSAVPRRITTERVFEVIHLAAKTMQRLGKKKPLIGICGLNPHAGEHGLLGSEEDRIRLAILKAKARGILADGPLPPDTAFLPKYRRRFDAYVAMYHDQGLIPFKMLAFDRGVNITLGLPIVRTSPDHGTAFDIAWKGIASPGSMVQSVFWAVKLAEANK